MRDIDVDGVGNAENRDEAVLIGSAVRRGGVGGGFFGPLRILEKRLLVLGVTVATGITTDHMHLRESHSLYPFAKGTHAPVDERNIPDFSEFSSP
ncbi:hypothetical protein D3C72_2300750 [compost metagenome]